MALHTRQVTSADLPVLRERQHRPDLGLVDAHFAAQEAGELIFAVVLDGEEPLGTAVLDLAADDLTPELRNMFVYPSVRRRGAGKALSSFLESEARRLGFPAVFLAVDPVNVKAVPLYVSLEYHPTGEHVFVAAPEVIQVDDGEEASSHYAIYKKSLTAR